MFYTSLPDRSMVKNLPAMQTCRTHKLAQPPGKIPWRRKWQPTPVILPGKFHGQRSLAGCSAWCCKESDMHVYPYAFGSTKQMPNFHE